MTDCLIIGGGPAGYTAAVYAGRSGLSPVLLEGPEPGGQLTRLQTIYNYPGFPDGVDAAALTASMRSQAVNCGATVRSGVVVDADLARHRVTLDDGTSLEARAVVIATGAGASYLGLPSEMKFRGMGVSACATCDGPLCKGKVVAVVGDGDMACSEALYLSTLARKVYVIVRRDTLRAVKANADSLSGNAKVEILYGTTVLEVLGDDSGVSAVRLEKDGRVFDMEIYGLFVAIGRTPQTRMFERQLELDDRGYVVSDGVKTGIPGVFVAGDVRATDVRQVVTAASDGCRAALEVGKYLRK